MKTNPISEIGNSTRLSSLISARQWGRAVQQSNTSRDPPQPIGNLKCLSALALVAVLLTFCPPPSTCRPAPLGTAFTYLGRLDVGGLPVNGLHGLQFGLYEAASGDTAVAGPWTNNATAVSNWLFTVTLDFGSQFNSSVRIGTATPPVAKFEVKGAVKADGILMGARRNIGTGHPLSGRGLRLAVVQAVLPETLMPWSAAEGTSVETTMLHAIKFSQPVERRQI